MPNFWYLGLIPKDVAIFGQLNFSNNYNSWKLSALVNNDSRKKDDQDLT